MIFLHSSFRTSSTYIWSRFRILPDAIAYYEIFNEILAVISKQNINEVKPDSWDSKHPAGAPYFLEFVPFLRDSGGIADFDPAFSFERFIPSSGLGGPISEREAAYVRGLVDHAEQRGRIPVLTATRSLGRVAGLKSAVPGLHVLLYRNLHQQWCSYSELAANGQRYYIDTIFRILNSHKHDPILEHLSKLFSVGDRSASSENTFYLFLFIHIYLYSYAADAADVIVDTNRLAVDQGYRHEIEQFFVGQNLRVDFSDARQSTAFSLVDFPCKYTLSDQIKAIMNTLSTSSISEKGRAFTKKIVDEFLEEYERHEFYNKRVRVFLKSTLRDKAAALSETEEARRNAAGLRGERDGFVMDRDRLARERDEAAKVAEEARRLAESRRSECDALTADRDRLARGRDEATAAAEEARRLADSRRSERDTLASDRDRLAVERDDARRAADEASRLADATRSECDALVAERDRLGLERDDWMARSAEARRQAELRLGERDALAADRTAIERERDAIRRDIVALTAECDRLASERDGAIEAGSETERLRARLEERYGELTRWSVAFHDSTAASLSWRLTRPLRRIGIGRPKRPPKPDFL